MISLKQASMFEAAMTVGAASARLRGGVVTALAEYGRQVGMAFQLGDDLIDFTGSSSVTGKPITADVRLGKPSIITIRLAKALGVPREELAKHTDGSLDRLPEALKVIDGAKQLVKEFSDAAIMAIVRLPSTRSKKCLVDIAHGLA